MDALIHVVNAAGLSAFNPVERRMAPLSHDLAGIILPHDTYGSHLDAFGKTIDSELEEKNFYTAASVLSEVWSKTIINDHQVDCKPMPVITNWRRHITSPFEKNALEPQDEI